MQNIKKILIANRGEIAVRIIRTAREMGINTVVIFSEQDHNSLHVEKADESWSLGDGSLTETYLNAEKIVDIAKKSNADAIHPGYGFLAENADFANLCRDNQIIFIGPGDHAIKIMGNKSQAAKFVASIDIPLLDTKTGTIDELKNQASNLQFPVMIKAAAGGGGKGMRIVHNASELEDALESTSREAKNYFGNGEVYIEKYIENPKHIEIQVLGDKHENYIHLNERECSVQRRHQKIIEEAPSPTLDEPTRQKMGEAALKIARTIKYVGAGTVEFLVDEKKNFHFLEMNTRIQVEHPVSESITGIDIVKEQILIADNKKLSFRQKDIGINGHAIEARIYAEDPLNDFLPSPGRLKHFSTPSNANLRLDNGVRKNDVISTEYDPLIAKAIVWGEDRKTSIKHLAAQLEKFEIAGIRHNLKYLEEIVSSKEFKENSFTTNLIDHKKNQFVNHLLEKKKAVAPEYLIAAYIFFHSFNVETNKEQAWNSIGYWRPFMHWDIHLPDKIHRVEFTRQNNQLSIKTDQQKYKANLIRFTDDQVILEIRNNSEKLNLFTYNNQTEILFNGFNFSIMHNNYQHITDNKKEITKTGKNGEKVLSPMFGKVVDIKVEKEMQVKEGQTLMILEAMKMENNIQATHDTKIKQIKVKKGQQVEDGQILIETY